MRQVERAGVVVDDRLELARWVTRRPLLAKPIHRWFTFPHSFTNELVHSLIDEWGLSDKDSIVDPFVGAGTTLLAARERRIPATGYDISPLAAFVSRVKSNNYSDLDSLREAAREVCRRASSAGRRSLIGDYPAVLRRALPGESLPTLVGCREEINGLCCSQREKDFLTLALLAILPSYSHAQPSGGWLKWMPNSACSSTICDAFSGKVEDMLADLEAMELPPEERWGADVADARSLPVAAGHFTALITSPPYPNRHDYTRVFCIELLFAFLDADRLRSLRRQTVESHPEARPIRGALPEYEPPELLESTLRRLRRRGADPRVLRMLSGYFMDMHLLLLEARRVCRVGSRIGLVVGNAQYSGVPVLADELLAAIGEEIGLRCEKIALVRLRGNSAQQMAKFGRRPSRESIVTFSRPLGQ